MFSIALAISPSGKHTPPCSRMAWSISAQVSSPTSFPAGAPRHAVPATMGITCAAAHLRAGWTSLHAAQPREVRATLHNERRHSPSAQPRGCCQVTSARVPGRRMAVLTADIKRTQRGVHHERHHQCTSAIVADAVPCAVPHRAPPRTERRGDPSRETKLN
eukprot:scaffold4993_cov211-Prasinococcus_capsulatus_cf.AAC.9